MFKNTGLILLLVCTICFLAVPIAEAADKHVSDCLDNSEDCLEEMEEPEINQDGEDNELVEDNTFKPTSLAFNIVKMIFALLLVLALIYIILGFIKKRNRHQQVGILENIGGITVGQNKSIQIIRIDEKMYVVGVGDNVELLKELTEEEALNITENKQETTIPAPTFLQPFMKKATGRGQEEKPERRNEDFTDTLQQELNKLKENRHQLMDHYEKKDDEHV